MKNIDNIKENLIFVSYSKKEDIDTFILKSKYNSSLIILQEDILGNKYGSLVYAKHNIIIKLDEDIVDELILFAFELSIFDILEKERNKSISIWSII